MAKKLNMDFECPQFVDFATELDNSSKDDLFFGHVIKYPSEMEEEENKLLDKMTAALSIIENTPKLKKSAVNTNFLSQKFSTNICSEVKPSVKADTVPGSTVGGLHRSKSIARLNKIVTGNANKCKGLRKRSSSLNDLRTHKKHTFPMTPMCLKRTIIKGRVKNLKTTEERELEEIAKLQKQLIQHLRYNEQTLKRMKLRSKPSVISKNTHGRSETLKGQKGLNPSMENLNVPAKEARRNIHALPVSAMNSEAKKLNNIIKGHLASNKPMNKGLNGIKPSTSSVAGAEGNENCKSQVKKPLVAKKPGFHSGLIFCDNIKKTTTLQPFSFDGKTRNKIKNTEAEQKEVSLSNSILRYKMEDCKENVPSSTTRRGKTMQNMKCDIAQQLAENKKIVEKYAKNRNRGLSLSENISQK